MENISTSPAKEKLLQVWNKRPLIISGPCSAETEDQVLQTAQQLAATGKVDMLRAGIWKPRTKPGMFEGVGEKGLPWMLKAKQLTGLPYTIEAATAKQVELALAHEVDVIWIGARTTANPFSVQEVANALQGADIPVLIKNPTNPDIELWSGAVERIMRAGIRQIGLIHRGFSSYGNTEFRNAPMWQIAIDMKLRYPELLFLNDPSHICGRVDILQAVMQRAVDLNYDGLMIESHIHPHEAWSDAAQQVTPQALSLMLDSIIWRKENTNSKEYHEALETLRQKIGYIDDELMQLLARRMNYAEQIGAYKKENNVTILQSAHWNKMIRKVLKVGMDLGLSKEFILKYFDAIHMESINRQKNVMDD